MWEFVDKVVYINLEKRKDRNAHMIEMTKTFGDKVMRFNAIEDNPGYLGCSQSHIAVLEMAIQNNWRNVLILEDDCQWNRFKINYQKLEFLAKSYLYDVILLGGSTVFKHPNDRLISAQTTTAYLVNNHYYKPLLENYREGFQLLKSTNQHALYALDQYWKNLQSKDVWYVISDPCMVYQIPDYSDIENHFVDYRSAFKIQGLQ
jgi:glycosyl transferase family 25